MVFPCKDFMLNLSQSDLEVRYYTQELLRLSERRQVVLNDMVTLAQPLPEYDILRPINFTMYFRPETFTPN